MLLPFLLIHWVPMYNRGPTPSHGSLCEATGKIPEGRPEDLPVYIAFPSIPLFTLFTNSLWFFSSQEITFSKTKKKCLCCCLQSWVLLLIYRQRTVISEMIKHLNSHTSVLTSKHKPENITMKCSTGVWDTWVVIKTWEYVAKSLTLFHVKVWVPIFVYWSNLFYSPLLTLRNIFKICVQHIPSLRNSCCTRLWRS